MADGARVEELRISGDQVVAKVKELVAEGNVRRIIIKNDEGRILIEVPLTIGVIGAVLLPVWAAIGALAALATRCTIVVERETTSGDAGEPGGSGATEEPGGPGGTDEPGAPGEPRG